jgi:hypothetical protein
MSVPVKTASLTSSYHQKSHISCALIIIFSHQHSPYQSQKETAFQRRKSSRSIPCPNTPYPLPPAHRCAYQGRRSGNCWSFIILWFMYMLVQAEDLEFFGRLLSFGSCICLSRRKIWNFSIDALVKTEDLDFFRSFIISMCMLVHVRLSTPKIWIMMDITVPLMLFFFFNVGYHCTVCSLVVYNTLQSLHYSN